MLVVKPVGKSGTKYEFRKCQYHYHHGAHLEKYPPHLEKMKQDSTGDILNEVYLYFSLSLHLLGHFCIYRKLL